MPTRASIPATSEPAAGPAPGSALGSPLAALRGDRALAVRLADRAARDGLYLLIGAPLGIGIFTVIATLAAVSVGTVMILIGLPLGLLTIELARWAAELERGRARIVDAEPIVAAYRPRPRRLVEVVPALADSRPWRDLAYALVQPLLAIFAGVVAIVVWSVVLALVLAPLYFSLADGGAGPQFGPARIDTLPKALLAVPIGLALTPAAFLVCRLLTWVSVLLTRLLLGDDRARLEARLQKVEGSRAGAVAAAVAELRRIERDLHDGAQARLISVGMGIGMARERLPHDPQGAAELLDQARLETREVLAELRQLARGIAPSVLADRGLEPALTSLVGRSPIPVELIVRLATRPPEAAERAAYFVTSEALTNVVKHARATRAHLLIEQAGPVLRATIHDDGAGGARLVHSGGLDGLRQRVEALDGTLHLHSPAGGPTTLIAELPCAS